MGAEQEIVAALLGTEAKSVIQLTNVTAQMTNLMERSRRVMCAWIALLVLHLFWWAAIQIQDILWTIISLI